MRTQILLGAILAGLLATGYAFTVQTASVNAGELKGLKILPPATTKVEIKKIMKKMADALGVQCDHCHDMDDMSKDTPKKETARAMMTMVKELNTKHFKGKMRVTCITCHNGKTAPKAN